VPRRPEGVGWVGRFDHNGLRSIAELAGNPRWSLDT
jgi:hypothetical protein